LYTFTRRLSLRNIRRITASCHNVAVEWRCQRAGVGNAGFTSVQQTAKEATARDVSEMEANEADVENAEVSMSTTNTTWRHVDDGVVAADTDDDGSGRYHVYLLLAVYPIVFLFGVFGNTLVITVILKYVEAAVKLLRMR